MRVLIAVLLLTVAFAGCASTGGGGDDGETETGTSSGTKSGTGSGTSSKSGTATSSGSTTGAPGSNTAPTGSISVTSNGTLATFNLTGTDADNDAVTWTLAFGDGNETSGTTLPTSVPHTYAAAGNYTAALELADGTETTQYNVTVAIVASGGGSGPGQVITAGWVAGSSDLGTFPEFFLCTVGPGDGVTHAAFTVEERSFGVPFVATITDESGGAGIVGWTITVSDPGCGADDVESFSVEGPGPIAGTVPDGYSFGYAWSNGGAMPEVTITFG